MGIFPKWMGINSRHLLYILCETAMDIQFYMPGDCNKDYNTHKHGWADTGKAVGWPISSEESRLTATITTTRAEPGLCLPEAVCVCHGTNVVPSPKYF